MEVFRSIKLKAKIFFCLLIIIIFTVFRGVSHFEYKKISESIKFFFRSEIATANSYALAKNLVDLERIGFMSCVKLTELIGVERVFYDTTNEENCNRNFFYNSRELTLPALSGFSYKINFLKPPNYYRLLLEFLTYFFTALLFHFVPKHLVMLLEKERAETALLHANLKSKRAIFELSQKVAHDIRSPISTLNLVSARIDDAHLRELSQAATRQINEISNKLLNESNESIVLKSESSNSIVSISNFENSPANEANLERSICLMLEELKSELSFKRETIKRNFSFDFDLGNCHISRTLIGFKPIVIKRCIDNFIQNAIEATQGNGNVTISAFNTGANIEISVSDNGRGIPKHILQRLGLEKLSFGKNYLEGVNFSGNGIALFNAKRDLAEIGAELKIYSVEGRGTTVSILI